MLPVQLMPRTRRNLEVELPPAFINYLRGQKFSTITQFRKVFHVTNPSRARAIIQKMLDRGLIVTTPDPRAGKKGMVFTLTPRTVTTQEVTPRKGRGKSQRYYDLQRRVLEYLGEFPDGKRFSTIPEDLGIKPNDATFIKGLKELVEQGKLVRTAVAGRGKAVVYSVSRPVESKPRKVTIPTAQAAPEEATLIETLLANYEDALNKIEKLQDRLEALEKREPEIPKALPKNLQERLKKLQARDKELASQL